MLFITTVTKFDRDFFFNQRYIISILHKVSKKLFGVPSKWSKTIHFYYNFCEIGEKLDFFYKTQKSEWFCHSLSQKSAGKCEIDFIDFRSHQLEYVLYAWNLWHPVYFFKKTGNDSI